MNNFFTYYDKFIHEIIYSYAKPQTKLYLGLTNKFQFDIYKNFQLKSNISCMESQMLKFIDNVRYATNNNINIIKKIVKYYKNIKNVRIIDFLITSLTKKRLFYNDPNKFVSKFVSNFAQLHPKIVNIFNDLILTEINKATGKDYTDVDRLETLFKYFMKGGSDNIEIFKIFEKNNIFVESVQIDSFSSSHKFFNIWMEIGRSSCDKILARLINTKQVTQEQLKEVLMYYYLNTKTVKMFRLLENNIDYFRLSQLPQKVLQKIIQRIVESNEQNMLDYIKKKYDIPFPYTVNSIRDLNFDNLAFMKINNILLPNTDEYRDLITEFMLALWIQNDGIKKAKYLLKNYNYYINYDILFGHSFDSDGYLGGENFNYYEHNIIPQNSNCERIYNKKLENFMIKLFDMLKENTRFTTKLSSTDNRQKFLESLCIFLELKYYTLWTRLVHSFNIDINANANANSSYILSRLVESGNINAIKAVINSCKIDAFDGQNKELRISLIRYGSLDIIKYFKKQFKSFIKESNDNLDIIIGQLTNSDRYDIIYYFLTLAE